MFCHTLAIKTLQSFTSFTAYLTGKLCKSSYMYTLSILSGYHKPMYDVIQVTNNYNNDQACLLRKWHRFLYAFIMLTLFYTSEMSINNLCNRSTSFIGLLQIRSHKLLFKTGVYKINTCRHSLASKISGLIDVQDESESVRKMMRDYRYLKMFKNIDVNLQR